MPHKQICIVLPNHISFCMPVFILHTLNIGVTTHFKSLNQSIYFIKYSLIFSALLGWIVFHNERK